MMGRAALIATVEHLVNRVKNLEDRVFPVTWGKRPVTERDNELFKCEVRQMVNVAGDAIEELRERLDNAKIPKLCGKCKQTIKARS